MKFLSIAASIVACAATVHSVALAQGGPIEECTYTVTSCYPPNVPTKISTIYEQSGVSTVTKSYDCQGCEDVTIMPKECYGVGLVRTISACSMCEIFADDSM